MEGSRACTACGQEIGIDARFCRHCGAAQEQARPTTPPPRVEPPASPVEPSAPPPPAAPPPPPPPQHPSASERIEQRVPGAGDFAAALTAQIRSPAGLMALLAGLLAAVGVVVVGIVVAAVTPESSIIGGYDAAVPKEGMLQACALLGVPFEGSGEQAELARAFGFDVSVQTMPALGLVVPIAAMAVSVRTQLPRTAELAPIARAAFALASAVPFALLMLIPALIGEATEDDVTVSPAAGTAFGLALLWGAVGALLGARPVAGAVAADLLARAPALGRVARPPLAAVRALLVALLLAAAVMTVCVVIQTARNAGDSQGDRSAVGASIENGLYVVEHGVHGVELGSFASFRLTRLAEASVGDEEDSSDDDVSGGLLVPLPVDDLNGLLDLDDAAGEVSYRVFDYSDAITGWKFIPWLIVLIALVVVPALYAGFASARVAGAQTLAASAAWGAVAGPVWALAMVVVNTITKGTDLVSIFGHANGDSVLGWTFLVATSLGALGGLLAARARGGSTGSRETVA